MEFEDKTFLLGVGAQKAGTTWLTHYLSHHRDIYMSPLKEMQYFNEKHTPDVFREAEVDRALKRRLRRLRRRRGKKSSTKRMDALKARLAFRQDDRKYIEFFAQNAPENVRYFGEFSPSYATIGEAGYRNILQVFPNTRVIFIVRDPVKRLLSQVRMQQSRKRQKRGTPQETLVREAISNQSVLAYSRYENTIRDLENVIEADRVIYLFYETLFRDETIAKLCERLGIELVPAKFSKVVLPSGNPEPISQALQDQLRTMFMPTYEFCAKRFGSELPWKIENPLSA